MTLGSGFLSSGQHVTGPGQPLQATTKREAVMPGEIPRRPAGGCPRDEGALSTTPTPQRLRLT